MKNEIKGTLLVLGTNPPMKNNYKITIFVVYNNPSDYPGEYVVREHEDGIPKPGEPYLRHKDWTHIISHMSRKGLNFIPRSYSDDPVIVGTYL